MLFNHCIVTYIDLQVHPIENLTECAFNIYNINIHRNGTSISSTLMTERRSLKMRTPSTRSNTNGGVASASPEASFNRKTTLPDNNPLKDSAIVSATVVGMADELLTRDAVIGSRFQNPLAILPESEEHPEKSLNLCIGDCKKVLVTEWRSAPLSSSPRSTILLMNVRLYLSIFSHDVCSEMTN